MLEVGRLSVVRAALLLLAPCLTTIPVQAQYDGGTGEPNAPYLIRTAEQMNAIGANPADWDKRFRLTADIDLSAYAGTNFNLIGNATTPFSGTFDGNGRSITHFRYAGGNNDNVGLFGYVCGANAEIRNLTLVDPEVRAKTGQHVGVLAGRLAGKVDNCHVFGGMVSAGQSTGGLIGDLTDTCTEPTTSIPSRVTSCLQDCSFIGIVSGLQRVGGLVGCPNGGTVARCFTDADISGENNVGGLLGQNNAALSNCYATGAVTGDDYVGGLAGLNSRKTATCYAAGHVKGTGLTAVEMMTIETFLDAGWDLLGETTNGTADIWWIDEGRDYPRLTGRP